MTDGRAYKLERVGPALVVQYYADGFENLPANERIFAYHLSRAAIAGRDIAFDQHHSRALELRRILEGFIRHGAGGHPEIPPPLLSYLKLFWLNNGWYDNITSKKFVPECQIGELERACEHAFPYLRQSDPHSARAREYFKGLFEFILDQNADPVLTNKSPDEDWIGTSAVNYYDRRLTLANVQEWAEKGNELHPLNSKILLEGDAIVEEIWRAGNQTHPAGRYHRELREVVDCLLHAVPFAADDYQKETIRKLIRFLETGDAGDFRDYNIHWVKDDSPIDFNLGFIEVYLDPRNQKGEFQASVYMTNERETHLMRSLAGQAQYFEDRGPWSAEFKKPAARAPVANVVDALIQTGGTGPISPVGINLPNEQAIRQQYGSKSILLSNISEAHDKAVGPDLVREFGFDAEEIEDELRLGTAADKLHTALHEVIGHGSAKMKAGLESVNPADLLPGYYSTIEEARADCVALWYADDPKLLELGIAGTAGILSAVARTMYRQMFRGALTQLRQIGDHSRLEEDHMKNRQLIVQYVLRNSDSARIERRDGKSYSRIVDYAGAKASIGVLLAELTRIKCEGDLDGARKLVDAYGLEVDITLRDEVRSRAAKLDLPNYVGFVQPKLTATEDSHGTVLDAHISYPLDLTAQMLEFSSATFHGDPSIEIQRRFS